MWEKSFTPLVILVAANDVLGGLSSTYLEINKQSLKVIGLVHVTINTM
jgi:hypothetical protein